MKKDSLVLLAPGFLDDARREYCPECAELWGVLAYFPAIKDSLDIHYLSISRPRAELVDLLGEENQNCPTLVLAGESDEYLNCGIRTHQKLRFIDNARDIGLYYAQRFGLPSPRGHFR